MFIFFFLFGTLILYQSSTNAQEVDSLLPSLNECGVLNEGYLYNKKKVAEIDEFPWIARIAYFNNDDGEINYKCLATLISKRYAITVSQCIDPKGFDMRHILLGDWDMFSDEDCDENGRCAPLPEKYEIEEIALHPNFDLRNGLYNVAVIRLNRDVIFTDYIRPICLPPDNVSNEDFVAQHAVYAGFDSGFQRINPSIKVKTFAHITAPKRCRSLMKGKFIPNNGTICASTSEIYDFMIGSNLMNVQVENSELKRFYLIGIAMGTPLEFHNILPNIFLKIASVMDFIKNNIVAE